MSKNTPDDIEHHQWLAGGARPASSRTGRPEASKVPWHLGPIRHSRVVSLTRSAARHPTRLPPRPSAGGRQRPEEPNREV